MGGSGSPFFCEVTMKTICLAILGALTLSSCSCGLQSYIEARQEISLALKPIDVYLDMDDL